ncbi:MAG: GAF domain-containing protein, partial [Longimicrobiales bacterium]
MNARTRFLIAWGAALIYVLAFAPAYTVMGVAVGMLSMLPVAAAGALLGLRAGLLAGLLSLPLNILLYDVVGAMPSDRIAPLVFGSLTCAAVGGLVGWLRELPVRLRNQSSELERERQALRQQIEQRRQAEAELHIARATLEAEIAERGRAEEAEHEQRALAEALRDTAAALTSTLNVDEVLDRILNNIERVVPHHVATIMLVEQGMARVVRHRGYTERGLADRLQTLRFGVADTPNLRQMAESGQPLVISDTQAYAGWVDLPESRWIHSYLGAPVILKGQVIGFLNLDSVQAGFFTSVHAERLKIFADQAAIAIENARLYNSVQQQALEIGTLYRASSQLLNPGSDLRALAQRIVLAMTQEFALADCGVMLVDETGTELKRVARAGRYQVLTNARLWLTGPGLTVAAVNTGEMIYAPEVSADPRYAANQSRTRSELVVPLQVGRRVIGALDLQSP